MSRLPAASVRTAHSHLSDGPTPAVLVGTSGFAAIPSAARDPPHRAASPAVPALLGPGPHQQWPCEMDGDGADVPGDLQYEVGYR
jgi:hypothetical protein